MPAVYVVRDARAAVSLARRPVLFALRTRAGRGLARETCRGARSSRGRSEPRSPMNRIARGCGSKIGRLRTDAANAGRRERDEARVCTGAPPRT